MSGDMPCLEPCRNPLCHWCFLGQCMDNGTCDKQMNDEQEN